MPVRVSSVIFSIWHYFPEAVKPCPKSPCVFTVLNEMVSKPRDYNNEHLSGGKGEKRKEIQSVQPLADALHSRGLGILLRQFITSCLSHALRGFHRTD